MPSQPLTTGRTMLIVDDDRDAADSLAMLLKFKGHVARTAYSGADALGAVGTWVPDVILVDLSMPDMPGEELCRRLRACAALKHASVVACTGHASERSLRDYRAAGFDGYLLKPIDPLVIESLLEGAVVSGRP